MTTLANLPEAHVPAADHDALALRAQSGDTSAAETLLGSFIAYLRSMVRNHTHESADADDALSVATLAFMEAIHAFEPGGSLVGLVTTRVRSALTASNNSTVPAHVPERTLKRYFSILRRADGDPARAVEMAPQFGMARETFEEIAAAVLGAESVAEADELGYLVSTVRSVSDMAEETLLLETAWKAVDDFETDILRLAYGFSDYRPNSDGEIAEKLGYGRATIQRRRQGALSKMRVSLGLPA